MTTPAPRMTIFQAATGGTPFERLDRLDVSLAGAECDLVLCPELFLTGYAPEAAIEGAEPSDGPASGLIRKIARRHGTAVAYGYAERAGDRLFNSVQVIGADGSPIAHHRKTVLPPGFEPQVFTPSDAPLRLFEAAGARIAILICYEAEFPECARHAAELGADVILAPTALAERWHDVAHRMIPTRAFENAVWLLYSNHAGIEGETSYLGHSCIVAPDGVVVARAGRSETILSSSISLTGQDHLRRRLPYLKDLPRLRQTFVRSSGEWL